MSELINRKDLLVALNVDGAFRINVVDTVNNAPVIINAEFDKFHKQAFEIEITKLKDDILELTSQRNHWQNQCGKYANDEFEQREINCKLQKELFEAKNLIDNLKSQLFTFTDGK